MQRKFILSILNILGLCVIVASVSIFFINKTPWVGVILIGLSLLCVVSLIPFGVKINSVGPDVVFGLIDNGILAVMAIFGGHFAGVAGAILGGVVGNAITDGIAGIFEGYYSERLRLSSVKEERTMLKSAVGKMAGCLLGAGVVLMLGAYFSF